MFALFGTSIVKTKSYLVGRRHVEPLERAIDVGERV